MTKELRDQLKTRIIHGNRSQLIVCLYDMCFAYMEDVRQDYKQDRWEDCKIDLDRLLAVIRRLQDDLDHSYEIAKELYVLYDFAIREIEKCRYKKDLASMDAAERIMKNLYVGMQEMAKQDQSKPLMRQSEVIMAGLTYGKNSLEEISPDATKRGFYV